VSAPAQFPLAVRVLGALALGVVFVVGFTPVVAVVDEALEPPPAVARRTPVDAVVVLGAGLSPDGVLSDHSLRRAMEGIALVREGRAPLVLLQGPRLHGHATEAVVRADLARRLGLAEGQILVEPRGNTTAHEARVAWERLGPSRRSILLVTGRYHMSRASRMFTRAGFDVTPAPVTEESARTTRADGRLGTARAMLTEVIARIYNRLTGSL
jgi:uncharacterized SAM-binding protein YcdF (DUF218 family)